jgi:hypothetical protein
MAYDPNKMNKWSQGNALGCNQMWNYTDTGTAIATLVAANFFDPINEGNPTPLMNIGDLIWIIASDVLDGEFAVVTAIDPHITVSVFDVVLGVGAVGTNNLADQAVTAAKIEDNTITDDQVAVNGLTSAALDKTTIQYTKVAMTAAQFNGMYAAPFLLIAAPGANKMIVVKQAVLAMTFVAAQYANGGAVALQYDSTVHGAGPAASATVAAATIDGYAASSDVGVAGADTSGASSTKVNKGIYLSNATAAFDTGDGTWNVHIWYEVVTL